MLTATAGSTFQIVERAVALNPKTFSILPPLCRELAQGMTRALLSILQHKPESTVRCCCIGNWTTNERKFLDFADIGPVALEESANDAHQLAVSINAEYVMTALDLPGPPRSTTVGIETHSGTYVVTFPIVRKSALGTELTLGPAKFKRSEQLPAPFDYLLTLRTTR